MSYSSPSANFGTTSRNPSAWSLEEQLKYADAVFADFDNRTYKYTYTDLRITALIRRQQRERAQRLKSRRLWLVYFHRATH
jgi:hypothetical protein